MFSVEQTDRDRQVRPYLPHLTELDRLIHEPSRLGVLSVLAWGEGGWMGYQELHEVTGLSKGNLSNHLAKLEEAGVVAIQKRFVGKKPQTLVSLTQLGGERLSGHLEQICSIKESLDATEAEQ